MQVIPKMENKRAKWLHHPLLKALQTLNKKVNVHVVSVRPRIESLAVKSQGCSY